jgi:elongation factor P--beta-lysine ligase
LTADRIVEELEQAPEDEGVAERWNWWIGSLELADGDYERFAIRRWQSE